MLSKQETKIKVNVNRIAQRQHCNTQVNKHAKKSSDIYKDLLAKSL